MVLQASAGWALRPFMWVVPQILPKGRLLAPIALIVNFWRFRSAAMVYGFL
jgi:hypothetical protein